MKTNRAFEMGGRGYVHLNHYPEHTFEKMKISKKNEPWEKGGIERS